MLTFDEAKSILDRVTYKPNWLIVFQHTEAPCIWQMWASFETIDSTDGKLISLESRVWFVDSTFSEDDLINTAFLMFKQTEEHEMMEFFKVDKIPIFNPHITVAAQKAAFRESFGEPVT